MMDIFKSKVPFGILPGGSEEIIISEAGKECIYIKNRAGFIKYALQHGYNLAIGYTFGESDLYKTIPYWKEWRLQFFKKTKIPLFMAYGPFWWLGMPFLPSRNKPLQTVFGNPIQLPHKPNPTNEEIEYYHDLYMKKLEDLFERNKTHFGYADRKLEFY